MASYPDRARRSFTPGPAASPGRLRDWSGQGFRISSPARNHIQLHREQDKRRQADHSAYRSQYDLRSGRICT